MKLLCLLFCFFLAAAAPAVAAPAAAGGAPAAEKKEEKKKEEPKEESDEDMGFGKYIYIYFPLFFPFKPLLFLRFIETAAFPYFINSFILFFHFLLTGLFD